MRPRTTFGGSVGRTIRGRFPTGDGRSRAAASLPGWPSPPWNRNQRAPGSRRPVRPGAGPKPVSSARPTARFLRARRCTVLRPRAAGRGPLRAIDAVGRPLDAGRSMPGIVASISALARSNERSLVQRDARFGDLSADLPDGASGGVAVGRDRDAGCRPVDAMPVQLGQAARGRGPCAADGTAWLPSARPSWRRRLAISLAGRQHDVPGAQRERTAPGGMRQFARPARFAPESNSQAMPAGSTLRMRLLCFEKSVSKSESGAMTGSSRRATGPGQRASDGGPLVLVEQLRDNGQPHAGPDHGQPRRERIGPPQIAVGRAKPHAAQVGLAAALWHSRQWSGISRICTAEGVSRPCSVYLRPP